MSLLRRSQLEIAHPKLKYTSVDLSAYLVQRETKSGRHLFIENVSAGGFIYSSGIKHRDRLVSVNYLSVDKLSFDEILEVIHSLSTIMLSVERSVNGENIPIVAVMDIDTLTDDSPNLKSAGFYFNTTIDYVKRFLTVRTTPVHEYSYTSMDNDVRFTVTEGIRKWWLEVDNNQIKFTTSVGSKTRFTLYKYSVKPDEDPASTIMILVPIEQTDQCLAASRSNDLMLKFFDENRFTSNEIFGRDDRFLTLVPQVNGSKIGGTVTGYYITKKDTTAIMTPTGSLFTVESAPEL